MERPDLTSADPAVRAYIAFLEEKLARIQGARPAGPAPAPDGPDAPEAAEAPTSQQLITISAAGQAKRTPRHLYGRQRRGGMGVFDLETPETDPLAFVLTAAEEARLLLLTNLGRVFPLPVRRLPAGAPRDRGRNILEELPLRPGERLVAVVPAGANGQLVLASRRGWVRMQPGSRLTGNLIPGLMLHDPDEGGFLAAACWSEGGGDIFLATRQGNAIRFDERQIPGTRGRLGVRLPPDDEVVAVTPVQAQGSVFLLGSDGKGTIREMSGFRQNKAPGSGPKTAFKTDRLVAAQVVAAGDDIFIVSRLGKIIRFSADDIPAKTGAVQGVNCMALRADESSAATVVRLAA